MVPREAGSSADRSATGTSSWKRRRARGCLLTGIVRGPPDLQRQGLALAMVDTEQLSAECEVPAAAGLARLAHGGTPASRAGARREPARDRSHPSAPALGTCPSKRSGRIGCCTARFLLDRCSRSRVSTPTGAPCDARSHTRVPSPSSSTGRARPSSGADPRELLELTGVGCGLAGSERPLGQQSWAQPGPARVRRPRAPTRSSQVPSNSEVVARTPAPRHTQPSQFSNCWTGSGRHVRQLGLELLVCAERGRRQARAGLPRRRAAFPSSAPFGSPGGGCQLVEVIGGWKPAQLEAVRRIGDHPDVAAVRAGAVPPERLGVDEAAHGLARVVEDGEQGSRHRCRPATPSPARARAVA